MMKDWDELDKMTLWEITTNEGALTMATLSIVCGILAIMYMVTDIYYKVKYWRIR